MSWLVSQPDRSAHALLPIAGRVVTADAMHTQRETARFLVEEKHAHYLFTAKDNQKSFADDIKAFNWEASPPSVEPSGTKKAPVKGNQNRIKMAAPRAGAGLARDSLNSNWRPPIQQTTGNVCEVA